MRDHIIEGLLALFTSSDRAEAMAGDLIEERETRGSSWFWLHVARTTLAPWRNALTEAPLRVLALVLAGFALLLAPALGGVAAVFLFPGPMDVRWIALPVIWWGGALWIGASLVTLAPRRGMAACALLAASGAAVLIGLAGPAVWRDPSNTDFLLFCTTGLLAAMPLLAGAAAARRRLVSLPSSSEERHR